MADDEFTADFLSLPEDPLPVTEDTNVPSNLMLCSCGHCGGTLVNPATDWRHRGDVHAQSHHEEEIFRGRGIKRKFGEGSEQTRNVRRGRRELQLHEDTAGVSQNRSFHPLHCYQ